VDHSSLLPFVAIAPFRVNIVTIAQDSRRCSRSPVEPRLWPRQCLLRRLLSIH
jgi:hypothetical protein